VIDRPDLFELRIRFDPESGDMPSPEDLTVSALRVALSDIMAGQREGRVLDCLGKTCGTWYFDVDLDKKNRGQP